MRFRQFSAVKTLNGKLGWCFRKCLFSVTNISAPTHSVYAAINASASFSPLASYFAPNSKGIKKSSSIVVKVFMKLTNCWKFLGVRFTLTSSTIVLHIQTECVLKLSIREFIRDSQLSFLKIPNPNIYSFASRMSSKFFLPEFFSGFTKMFNNLFFSHSCERGRFIGNTFTQVIQQFFCVFFLFFHYLLPPIQDYYYLKELSTEE